MPKEYIAVYYMIARAVETILLAILVWKSIGALASSESSCPGKVTQFVWFILLSSLAKLAVLICCYRVPVLQRPVLIIVLALLLGLVGQLYILGACDQPLNDVTQLFVTLQYAIIGWEVPGLAAMLWIVSAEPAKPAVTRCATPRPSPEDEVRDELQDAFDGASPVVELDMDDL